MLFSPADIQATKQHTQHTLVTLQESFTPFDLNDENYSSFSHLLRVTSLCILFVRKCQKVPYTYLQASREAITIWIRHMQSVYFNNQLEALNNQTNDSLVRDLSLFIDKNGLIRCGGRLQNSTLTYNAKHPILIYRKCHLTKLIIHYFHSLESHSGVNQTLASLRQFYWIPQGRNTVAKVVRSCAFCKRYTTAPYEAPKFPPFPKERVQSSPAFQSTGLDYFGHLFVKGPDGTATKVWVLLFTCLSIRAVHLELVPDLSTQEFLLAFRRFVARRASKIFSDNGSQLVLASEVLHRLWTNIGVDQSVTSFLDSQSCSWTFLPAFSPWSGGVYERMVGLVKQTLRKMIGRAHLSFSVLETLLFETEFTVNSRPLTVISAQFEPAAIITPNSFLISSPRKLPVAQCPLADDERNDPTYVDRPDSADKIVQLYKKQQRQLHDAWLIWKKHYLQILRERYQGSLKQGRSVVSSAPNVGDIVIIADDTPRSYWKLGKIQSVHTSEIDGLVRSAKVKLGNGNEITRPVAKLYPLEISK